MDVTRLRPVDRVSEPSPAVVVTLVHGTILLARWPWLSRTGRRLGALWPSRGRDPSRDADTSLDGSRSRDGDQIDWYKTDRRSGSGCSEPSATGAT